MLEIGKDKVEDLFELSSQISIATTQQDVSLYDFDFRKYFQTKTIIREVRSNLILRIGAIYDYEKVYHFFAEEGLFLINSIEEHYKVSLLPNWYHELRDLTPKSKVYETLPTYEQVTEHFAFPIFLKGERQTNKHNKSLCIAENKSDFEKILSAWETDNILNWQKMVVREFIDLVSIEQEIPNQLKKSFEVRVFVWFGQVISMGQYWESETKIYLSEKDTLSIKELTKIIFKRLPIPFMVIDFGKTKHHEWIVIELNDAQESGYALNSKINLWNTLIEHEHFIPHL